jgi:hypothetical protein
VRSSARPYRIEVRKTTRLSATGTIGVLSFNPPPAIFISIHDILFREKANAI